MTTERILKVFEGTTINDTEAFLAAVRACDVEAAKCVISQSQEALDRVAATAEAQSDMARAMIGSVQAKFDMIHIALDQGNVAFAAQVHASVIEWLLPLHMLLNKWLDRGGDTPDALKALVEAALKMHGA